MKEILAVLVSRILCSRPFLALHVLLGRPVMYRMTVTGPLLVDGRNEGARIVGNTVLGPDECTVGTLQ